MKNYIAIFLASLVLLSNLGIAMSSHLCGGKQVEAGITIGGYTFACGMAEMEEMEIIPKTPNSITPLPCCDNIHTLFDVEDRYQTKVKAEGAKVLTKLPIFETAALSPPAFPVQKTQYEEYAPPASHKNFQIAFQVFRI